VNRPLHVEGVGVLTLTIKCLSQLQRPAHQWFRVVELTQQAVVVGHVAEDAGLLVAVAVSLHQAQGRVPRIQRPGEITRAGEHFAFEGKNPSARSKSPWLRALPARSW